MANIFTTVTGLFPSIYLWKKTNSRAVYLENIIYIQAVLNEARRIKKLFGLNVPIYVYTSVEPKNFPMPPEYYDSVRFYNDS